MCLGEKSKNTAGLCFAVVVKARTQSVHMGSWNQSCDPRVASAISAEGRLWMTLPNNSWRILVSCEANPKPHTEFLGDFCQYKHHILGLRTERVQNTRRLFQSHGSTGKALADKSPSETQASFHGNENMVQRVDLRLGDLSQDPRGWNSEPQRIASWT